MILTPRQDQALAAFVAARKEFAAAQQTLRDARLELDRATETMLTAYDQAKLLGAI